MPITADLLDILDRDLREIDEILQARQARRQSGWFVRRTKAQHVVPARTEPDNGDLVVG